MLTIVGQRYHVVVEARPSNDLTPLEDQNYWIRIVDADGCFDVGEGQQNELLGTIHYNAGSTKEHTTTGYQGVCERTIPESSPNGSPDGCYRALSCIQQ